MPASAAAWDRTGTISPPVFLCMAVQAREDANRTTMQTAIHVGSMTVDRTSP